ncbi:CHAT domain-containing protein [Microbacterium hominis]|uniref:CHAT domain-containing protein n=1 Tax=Microbacterium hominis TaxID=162426 RepID=A0A7D4Q0T7_9MICO|nr:CHAT domain-containing protein [Microbacterium hominis]QKJ18411.1 CHAT domain-containing protein [Microbacterium hominis]
MGRSAESLHHAAVELTNRGRFAAAQRLLARADELTDDGDLRARIVGTEALILARLGDVDGAEAASLRAWEAPGLATETRAILAGQLGSIAERTGRLDEADLWLTRAIDALEDSAARAHLLLNRGVVGMERRDFTRAADDTREAADIYSARGLDIDAAEARHNLGYIDLLRGDIVAALAEMTRARPTLAAASRASEAISDLDRAEVLRDAGLVREAEELLASAATSLAAARMPKERAEAEFALAQSLLSHDPLRARRMAASAARRFRGARNDRWAARAEALRLRADLSGGGVTRQGRVPDAARVPAHTEVERIAAALEGEGLASEAAALRLTRALWEARRGRAPADGAVGRVPRGATMEVQLLAHEVRATRAVARGRTAEARRHAEEGLEALLRWQREFGSLDLQTSLVWRGHPLVAVGVQAAMRTRRADLVFEWSERARHLNLQVVPLRPPPDPELAAELTELRVLSADGDGWLSNPRAVELQNRARQRQWSGTRSAAVQHRTTLDEAQGALDDDTAILAYVYSGDALSVLVVTAHSARLVDLGDWAGIRAPLPGLRADLDMAAAMQSGPMAAVVRRSLGTRLEALSRAILAPALAVAGDRRLVLTTPGVLQGIPWAMLPDMRGRIFTLAASVSRWVSFPRLAPAATSAGFAVGPRVPRAAEEARVAASAWERAATLDPATIGETTRLASDVDVLHVSAHGRHAADNALFSGLELADGTLFGYDIDLVEKVPDVVVLSACEVGRSSVRWGEEAIGMARVWLHAGTRCVVAAPVVVADDDACELLGAMHAGLAAGAQPAEALAAATESTGIVAPFQPHGAGF